MSLLLNLKRKYLLHRHGSSPLFKELLDSVDLSLKVEEARFTVFDTETTGLNPKKDELVSLGALRIEGMTLNLSKNFHKFTMPEDLKTSSVEIHGITMSELKRKACKVEELIEDFLSYARGTVLVGFNVEFDIKFLNRYSLKLFGFPVPFYRVDVFRMWVRRGNEGKDLVSIAQQLDVPTLGAHSALDDAYMTALLFLKLAHRLREAPLSALPLVL